MTVSMKVLAVLCGWMPLQAAGQKAYGIALRGGFNADGTPPTLTFGTDPLATSISSDASNTVLEVKRGGEAVASFSSALTRMPHTQSAGEVSTGGVFEVGGRQQWTLWQLDTFDTPDSGVWTPNDRGFCGNPGDHFLGGHCRFGATVAQRQYSLPAHTRVRIRARIHFIDKWEGESISLSVHGEPVWSTSHSWCPNFLKWMCEKYGIDTCGRSTPDRLSVKAEAIFAHTGADLDVAFNSSLPVGTDACYTSWGVDDVSIELM